MLTIYNTLTGTKEPFTPMVAGRVEPVRVRDDGV